MNKICIIIRGVSGSGKSTLAKSLASLNSESVICEADEFFYRDGKYDFDPNLLGKAHDFCKHKFAQAIIENKPLVICSNTNTSKKEYDFYLDFARDHGYIVHVVIAERFSQFTSVHNVPNEVLEKQAARLRQSITL